MSHLSLSRRGRSFAIAVALAFTAAGLSAAPANADAPEGWPTDAWPTCADADAQYCIADAALTPVGADESPLAGLGLSAWASGLDGGNGVLSFNWAINGLDGDSATPEIRGGDVRLVLRVGQFAPRYTMALAKGMTILRSVDDLGNTTLTITGKPVHIDWVFGDLTGSCFSGTSCGDEDTIGDVGGYRFSGNTQDLATWGEPYTTAMDGMYIATNAEARPNSVSFTGGDQPSWYMSALGNPHLDPTGNPVRGSFNAWIPPTYFTSLATTAEAAAAVGFDVISSEGGESVSIPATVALQNEGVSIDVPDIGFSVHRVDVLNQASDASPDATVPDRPPGVAAAPRAGGLSASWTSPVVPPLGLAPTSYTARAFTAASDGTVAGRCTTTTLLRCTIPGLTNDVPYFVAVSATNALGEGPGTAVRVAGTPGATPTAPQSLHLTPGNGSLAAAWTAPASAGGTAISSYRVSAYRDASGGVPVRVCTSTGTPLGCTLTGLVNGTPYWVSAAAINASGMSVASARVGATPRTTPGVPRSVHATSTARRIVATWAAPTSTGGAPISQYVARVYASLTSTVVVTMCVAPGTARTCTTAALVAGRAYYVAVSAKNVAGSSVASARVPVLVRS
ncbi:fibronectin type III domain-containing protein [Pengzhenrongella sp.]|uniref:fibronectin type III domain-containing protein n=1 Tax=Pengzhenrongella sp. TaxID=2888820 RepID=UPI002F954AD3